MLNFGQQAQERDNDSDLIPKDTLVWAVLTVRGVKRSSPEKGEYLDLEYTIAEGQPHQKRKVWDKIANPFDPLNKDGWKDAGHAAIRRILEVTAGAVPDNSNSYVINSFAELSGRVVPIHIGIEAGKDGYDDKNKIIDILSPYSSLKGIVDKYNKLKNGVHSCAKEKPAAVNPVSGGSMFNGTAAPAPVQAPLFSGAQVAPALAAPAFLAPVATPPAAAPTAYAPPAAVQPAAYTPEAAPAAHYAQPPAQPAAAPVGFPAGQPAQPQLAPAAYVGAVTPQPTLQPTMMPSPETTFVAPAQMGAAQYPSNQA